MWYFIRRNITMFFLKKTDIQALFNMTRYFLYVQVTVLRNMHKKTPIYGVFFIL
jgi:hypothetical protein